MDMPKTVLGRLMIEAGLLDHEDVERLEEETEGRSRRMGLWVAGEAPHLQDHLAKAFCTHMGLPYVDLNKIQIPQEVVKLVPRRVLVEEHAVPTNISQEDGRSILYVALFDPTDYAALESIGCAVGEVILKPVAATYSQIQDTIERFWPEDEDSEERLPWHE